MQTRVMRSVLAGAAAVFIGACGDGPCIVPPCGPPIAAWVDVTSTTGTPISNASIDVTSNGITQTVPCQGRCPVGGYAGTYVLRVSAPQFAPTTLSITVTGKDAEQCGTCPRVDTQTLTVKLTPA